MDGNATRDEVRYDLECERAGEARRLAHEEERCDPDSCLYCEAYENHRYKECGGVGRCEYCDNMDDIDEEENDPGTWRGIPMIGKGVRK